MATTIDIENAKQIRQPMDVVIEMEMASDDVTLTYSGYSSTSKVADGVLSQPTWPMRGLADLQGDGFPLNGSRVLYDSSTTASQTNGKLGVRGNIGQSVTITISGNKSIASLFIHATGAESITFGGTTTPIINNVVTIPVGGTSITITLNPAKDTERIEVSQIGAGAKFVITNENLIRATVSLRSDLSRFGQTLPESELNVEVYQDTDIAEVVAAIPEDAPITYSAGYEGDMSPTRKFYVTGQVTWADNVLSIQAVDAVHFLNQTTTETAILGTVIDEFLNLPRLLLGEAGIDWGRSEEGYELRSAEYAWLIGPDASARDVIAFMNQSVNLTDETGGLIDGTGSLAAPLQFTYRDAGIPYLSIKDNGRRRDEIIKEEDCGQIKRAVERGTSSVSATWGKINSRTYSVNEPVVKIGTATMTKGVGTSLNFEAYAHDWWIGKPTGDNEDGVFSTKMLAKYKFLHNDGGIWLAAPGDKSGYPYCAGTSVGANRGSYFLGVGNRLPGQGTPQSAMSKGAINPGYVAYSQFIPWIQRYVEFPPYDAQGREFINTAQMWNVLVNAGVISSTETNLDLEIRGYPLNPEAQDLTYSITPEGETVTISDVLFSGQIAAKLPSGGSTLIYPKRALTAGAYRSPKTGSFTWKGDPRMQPRDITTFRRLDGTDTIITIENITLTHEGGGLSAEITYREGAI